MELSISGRHVDVTDAMRDHASERMQRLERYSSHIMRVRVTLSIEGDRHLAEIVASIRRRGELVAKSETPDMYLSIDQATEKMERQLHKVEERNKEHRDAGKDKRALEPPPPMDEDEDDYGDAAFTDDEEPIEKNEAES